MTILPAAYLPSIEYCARWAQGPCVVDGGEHFVKRSERNRTHILGDYISAMFDECVCTGCLCQAYACTGTTAKGYQAFQVRQAVPVRIAGGKHNIRNILLYFFIDVHLAYHFTGSKYIVCRNNRSYFRQRTFKIFTYN